MVPLFLSSPRFYLRPASIFAPLLTFSILLSASPVWAGSYSGPVYSGGTYTFDGITLDDSLQNDGSWGGGGGPAHNSACNGLVTATFTWQEGYPGEAPPKTVIVNETVAAGASAYAYGSNPSASADADDGRTDAPQNSSSDTPQSQSRSSYSSGTHYTTMPGDTTITLTCTPTSSASASYSPGGYYSLAYAGASISYKAEVFPVTVEWIGATRDGTAFKVLTGQQVTAMLTIPQNYPFSVKNDAGSKPMANWTISGDVFKNYDPTKLNKEQYSALTAEDKQKTTSVSLYTKKNKDPINASCTATLVFPADAKLAGGLPVVTVEAKELTSIKPDLADGKIASGKVTIVDTYLVYFGYSQSPEGQYWYDVNISVPAPFNGGRGGFAQVITPHREAKRVTSSPYPASVPYPKNDIDGLDTDYPYSFNFTQGSWPLPELHATGWDSPSQSLQPRYDDGGGVGWVEMYAYDIFKTFIMFQPTEGTSPVWIPMANYEWHWKAKCQFTNAMWGFVGAVEPSIGANHSWALTDEHPVWTTKHNYISTEDLLLPH